MKLNYNFTEQNGHFVEICTNALKNSEITCFAYT